MNENRNPRLTPNAKELRKQMTKEEKHLWYDFLKDLSCNVNRQKVIGNYIVDFYIAKYHIAVELDGVQHYQEQAVEKDRERDRVLAQQGITVLRYSNRDVNRNFEGVCKDILLHLV